MIEYAAELINMFEIINKKLTPREALRGKHTLRRLAEFVITCCGSRKLGRAVAWRSSSPSSNKAYGQECAHARMRPLSEQPAD